MQVPKMTADAVSLDSWHTLLLHVYMLAAAGCTWSQPDELIPADLHDVHSHLKPYISMLPGMTQGMYGAFLTDSWIITWVV